ncbi:MAG: DUF4287 domain-containing protein [Pseudomonadota bacterium]
MDAVDKARETQLSNIETKTGKTIQALTAEIIAQGLQKHGQMVSWVKSEWGLGHGDANTLVHTARRGLEQSGSAGAPQDPLDMIYSGKKAHQRPIHDAVMARLGDFGPFEITPKKSNVSLRRQKQFALIGPKTNTRFEIGVNLKEEASHPRMKAEKPGGMCQYTIALENADEIDDAMIAIVRRAYDAAG